MKNPSVPDDHAIEVESAVKQTEKEWNEGSIRGGIVIGSLYHCYKVYKLKWTL